MQSEFNLSQHARVRMQQRGIPPSVISLLVAFGATAYDGRGSRIRYFDKRARNRVRMAIGEAQMRQFDNLLNSYAVVACGDVVVTVGHRLRPVQQR